MLDQKPDRNSSHDLNQDLALEDPTDSSALVESRQYRLLAESIPHLAWIADADGSIDWYNRRWYEYTGTTPADMRGWGWQSVHDPGILPQVLERWNESIRSGEPWEMVFPLRGADGVFRPFLTRAIPIKDSHNNVLRWIGTNTEVSEQVVITAALRESEQRFRTATEAISGILWTNDATGKMSGEQPGWAAFTGQTEEEYQGYGWSKALHPHDVQPSIDAWEDSVRDCRLYAVEHRVLRRDGQYRLCSVRALPILDDAGHVREWVGVHTDITDIHTATDALRISEESHRVAAEITQLGHTRLDTATRQIVYCSPIFKANFGRKPNDPFIYADLLGSIHPEDIVRVKATLQEAIVNDKIYRADYRVFWPDGSLHWISASGRLIHFDDGTPPQMLGVTLDVTQKHLSESALLQTEKLAAVGRLASSIAHEINNPLEAVTNLLYLARNSTDLSEIHHMLDTAEEELRRVSIIANQTLRFHKQSSHPKDAASLDLFTTVLSIYQGKLRNSGIVVEKRKRSTRPIRVYEGDVRQVLNNLVGNAIDAMPGGGRLLIRTRESRNWKTNEPGVVLTIADTGTGISPETKPRIFDAFFTTKGILGTGLGLWVSAEIMRRHGGKIQVRSCQHKPHRGTVFCLFLPFNNAETGPGSEEL